MGIKRRLLENHKEWLFRVMNLHDVDFAIATDENGKKWVAFIEAHNTYSVSLHSIDDGPQIGRCIFTENSDVKKHSWEFCTRNPKPSLNGLSFKPDLNSVVEDVISYTDAAQDLDDNQGIHIYTSPNGTEWYLTNDSIERDRLKLFQYIPHARMFGCGYWFDISLLDQYNGIWNTPVTTPVFEIPPAPESERPYITKVSDKPSALLVLTNKGDGIRKIKHLNLTLNLKKELEPDEIMDIYPALRSALQREFPQNKIVIDLDQVVFVIHGTRITGRNMRAAHGSRYYCDIPKDQSQFQFQPNHFPARYC
ncbi:hypothetical protein MZD04_gp287 [Pseudomonas phage Psa21]|uniref:Uncharacterized protein n=1 Tax=Pseudomonas phage Psa21 TaxID=2530023 RepID=A0A481W600_9CAUD|nr:hypothetical protein MZD04_gp287 [Pseudomonas phage Psa21]QBJ02813.1 hypothetical protein PSA21_287 [Pseudomonas phage Psa21]